MSQNPESPSKLPFSPHLLDRYIPGVPDEPTIAQLDAVLAIDNLQTIEDDTAAASEYTIADEETKQHLLDTIRMWNALPDSATRSRFSDDFKQILASLLVQEKPIMEEVEIANKVSMLLNRLDWHRRDNS